MAKTVNGLGKSIVQAGRRIQWSYVTQESLLILVLPVFLILTGTTLLLDDFAMIRAAAVVLSLLAGAWLIFGRRAPMPLGKPLLLFMTVFAVSTAFSIDWSRSIEQLAITGAAVFLFALAADLTARGWPSELFVKALMLIGFAVPLLIWSQAYIWYRQWLSANPSQWAPSITYRPYYANVLVMPCYTLLIAAVARWFYTKAWMSRVLLSALILVLLATIFLTSSRGGWIGTAAGLALLAGLLYWKQKQALLNLWDRVRTKKGLLAIGGALILLALVAAGWLGLKILSHPSHGSFFSSRSFVWPAAIATFLQHPLVGQGPYTFGNAYLAYNSVPPNAFYSHAHSAYLNLLAEMGLLGVIAGGVVIFFLAKLLKRRLEQAQGMELSVVMAAAAGMLALLVHNIFDCFHTEPVAALGLFILLGAALGKPVQKTTTPLRRPYWVAVPILLTWLVIWMVSPMYLAVAAVNAMDLPRAQALFQEALRREPWSVIAHQQMGKVYALESEQGDSAALPKAVSELEQVVARDQSWSLNWINLAALYQQQGDLAKARQALDAAVKAAPDWSLPYLDLGLVAEKQGDRDTALAAYVQALNKGETVEAGFWAGSPVRVDAAAQWKAAQPVKMQQSIEDLRAAVAQNPETPGPYLALAAAELKAGNLERVEPLLQRVDVTFAYLPELIERDWLRAELSAAQGDYAQAAKLGEGVLRSYDQVGMFGPGTYGDLHYEHFMYRRPGMALEILPQVVRVEATRVVERREQVQAWKQGVGNGLE